MCSVQSRKVFCRITTGQLPDRGHERPVGQIVPREEEGSHHGHGGHRNDTPRYFRAFVAFVVEREKVGDAGAAERARVVGQAGSPTEASLFKRALGTGRILSGLRLEVEARLFVVCFRWTPLAHTAEQHACPRSRGRRRSTTCSCRRSGVRPAATSRSCSRASPAGTRPASLTAAVQERAMSSDLLSPRPDVTCLRTADLALAAAAQTLQSAWEHVYDCCEIAEEGLAQELRGALEEFGFAIVML